MDVDDVRSLIEVRIDSRVFLEDLPVISQCPSLCRFSLSWGGTPNDGCSVARTASQLQLTSVSESEPHHILRRGSELTLTTLRTSERS